VRFDFKDDASPIGLSLNTTTTTNNSISSQQIV